MMHDRQRQNTPTVYEAAALDFAHRNGACSLRADLINHSYNLERA